MNNVGLRYDWGLFGPQNKKEKRLSTKEKIKQLEDKVAELQKDSANLHAEIVGRTKVRGGRYFHMDLGKELNARDAIALIMDHLDMHFEHKREHYVVSPKPPPVEEEYDDD